MCNLAFYTYHLYARGGLLGQNKPVTACKNTAYFSKNGEKL